MGQLGIMRQLWGSYGVIGLSAPHHSRANRWALGPGTAGRRVSGSPELRVLLWGGQGGRGAGGAVGGGRQRLEREEMLINH